jgi:tetratricopeptide (TPR) repeat protein
MISIAWVGLVLVAAPVEPAFLAWAQNAETKIAAGDVTGIEIDFAILADRATKGVEAPEKFKAGFIKGVTERAGANNIGTQLVTQVKSGATVKLLRVKTDARGTHALFRVLSGAGVNYLDVFLERLAGKVVAVDVYIFLSGEKLGQSIGRAFMLTAADANKNFIERLVTDQQQFVKFAPKLTEMNEANVKKDFPAVLKIFDALPPAMKREKPFLLARYLAASSVNDDKQYQRAIEDFEVAFPNDPALSLLMIDGHFLRKNYDKALASVEALDKQVNDPFLNVLRGNMYVEKGNSPEAAARFKAAIAGEKTLEDGYWALITLMMREKKWKETGEWLNTIEREAGVVLADLTTIPEYADFVKSPEYKKWLKARAAR